MINVAMLDRQKHEELLNELLGTEIETSRKTEILQLLRVDHSTATQNISETAEKMNKLQKHHDDLVVSNSQLFRQIGKDMGGNDDEVKEKELSETITISQLEEQGGY